VDSALSLHSVVVATKNRISYSFREETFIANVNNSRCYEVDAVGTRVWNLLQQPRTVCEIRDAMLEEYDAEPERCERDLLEFLGKMQAEGLIEVEPKGSDQS